MRRSRAPRASVAALRAPVGDDADFHAGLTQRLQRDTGVSLTTHIFRRKNSRSAARAARSDRAQASDSAQPSRTAPVRQRIHRHRAEAMRVTNSSLSTGVATAYRFEQLMIRRCDRTGWSTPNDPFGGPKSVLKYFALHAPRGHLESPPDRVTKRAGELPLEGLRPKRTSAPDDAKKGGLQSRIMRTGFRADCVVRVGFCDEGGLIHGGFPWSRFVCSRWWRFSGRFLMGVVGVGCGIRCRRFCRWCSWDCWRRIREMAVLERWAAAHWDQLREPLGFTQDEPPHATTVSRALAACSSAGFAQAFVEWVRAIALEDRRSRWRSTPRRVAKASMPTVARCRC